MPDEQPTAADERRAIAYLKHKLARMGQANDDATIERFRQGWGAGWPTVVAGLVLEDQATELLGGLLGDDS